MMRKNEKNNLFLNPKSYFYSDCTKDDFFEGWRDGRDEYIKRLDLVLLTDAGASDNDVVIEDMVNIEETMEKIWVLLNSQDSIEFGLMLLNKYLQKYEVGKKFYSSYTCDHVKDSTDIYVGYSAYIVFANCLILAYNQIKNLQYASTLLKLCDAFISVELGEYLKKEKESLIIILQSEHKILSEIGKK